MELSKLQQKIINNKNNKIIVMADSAAGKTRVLTEKARQLLKSGIEPKEIAVITFTNMAAEELRQRLGEDYKNGIFIGTIHSLANSFLLSYGIDTSSCIKKEDFDELFQLVQKYPKCVRKIKYILLDEAQDSNSQQFDFIFNMIQPESFFLAGDLKQCQPRGTKILMSDQSLKNIEDIKIGDKVITYDLSSGRFCGGSVYNAKNYKVLNINKRISKEELIKVTLKNGKSSIYTLNHKCIINLDHIKENFLVYLMCDKNNRFRVGKSQFKNNTNTNIYRRKMLNEKCEKVWILKTFKTDKEARVFEDKISYEYQIPQITFQTNKTSYTEKDIDYIYQNLDTFNSAKKCLKDYKKDIRFPFSSKNDNIHYASNAYNICYACNIIPENMSMLCYNKNLKHKKEISPISKIEYLPPQEVYSLQIEENETYVADGIATHNSIYRWNGSEPELIEQLCLEPDVLVCQLNENYRNSQDILDFAKRLIKPTGLIDDSIPMRHEYGRVIEVPLSINAIARDIKKDGNYKDWAVLTRSNRELENIYSIFQERDIPCDTFKQGDLNKEQLTQKMNDNTVKILTIHSSKGLEWNKVVVVGAKYNSQEERNVCYVAATRARDLLVWTTKKNYKKQKLSTWE